MQVERLKEMRINRDNPAVSSALERLRGVVCRGENTMPAILECVEVYATVGEISQVFRDLFGEQKEI